MLRQTAVADVNGQCALGERENDSGLPPERTSCLSVKVLSYTIDLFRKLLFIPFAEFGRTKWMKTHSRLYVYNARSSDNELHPIG